MLMDGEASSPDHEFDRAGTAEGSDRDEDLDPGALAFLFDPPF